MRTSGVFYGYDLVNEPVQKGEAQAGCDYWSLQSRAAEAIRQVDPETPVIVEANFLDTPAGFATLCPLAPSVDNPRKRTLLDGFPHASEPRLPTH